MADQGVTNIIILDSLPSIKRLDLSSNPTAASVLDLLDVKDTLEDLVLSDCGLTSFTLPDGMNRLINLDLSNNNLTSYLDLLEDLNALRNFRGEIDFRGGYNATPTVAELAVADVMRSRGIIVDFEEIPTDVAGVVTIDITNNNYTTLSKLPYSHGTVYYNNYIYVAPIDYDPVESLSVVGKINQQNYLDIDYLYIRYSAEDDTNIVYLGSQLTRSGNYLYINASDLDNSYNLLIQIDLIGYTYKVFRLTTSYGDAYLSGIVLVDDTYLYYPTRSGGLPGILRYELSTFQDETDKFNVDTELEPIDYILDIFSGVSYNLHAGVVDGDYLYLSYYVGSVNPSKLVKLDTTTLTVSATADIPISTDDMDQNDTYIFLGGEVYNATHYGYGWAVTAVKKSNMVVTSLIKHSTEAASKVSYGVQLITLDSVEYLFNLRTDGRINILDISDVDSWSPLASSDAYSVKILSFVYSDGITTRIPNEIVIDDRDVIHILNWQEITELIKFRISSI